MATVLGSVFHAVLVFGVCVGISMFVVVPLAKHLLVSSFESLNGRDGVPRLARQTISYPIVALLSRQRKARRGNADAIAELFVLAVVLGSIGSFFVQGLVMTVLSAALVWVLFVVGHVLMSD